MDIGVKNLRRIKDDMAATKARESGEIEQDARDAEEALDRALDTVDVATRIAQGQR